MTSWFDIVFLFDIAGRVRKRR